MLVFLKFCKILVSARFYGVCTFFSYFYIEICLFRFRFLWCLNSQFMYVQVKNVKISAKRAHPGKIATTSCKGVLVLLICVQILVSLDCFFHSITMEVWKPARWKTAKIHRNEHIPGRAFASDWLGNSSIMIVYEQFSWSLVRIFCSKYD